MRLHDLSVCDKTTSSNVEMFFFYFVNETKIILAKQKLF